jgi:superfamily II DNA or RNA helicase
LIQTNLFEEEKESPSFELWPHQIRAKGELRQAMKMGHKRVVLQIATGGGKTRLCAEIILDALKKGSKVVFAVPLKALVDQTVREFQEAGIKDIGVIQAQHAMTDWMAPVQVASIQTLIRRPLRSRFNNY